MILADGGYTQVAHLREVNQQPGELEELLLAFGFTDDDVTKVRAQMTAFSIHAYHAYLLTYHWHSSAYGHTFVLADSRPGDT